MTRFSLAVIVILATNSIANGAWQRYWQDTRVTAAYRIGSFATFRDHPSVWVRWHYRTHGEKYAGKMIQFTADCAKRRLYEISAIPYDHDGNYLGENRHYDAPMEYPLREGTLNGATYRLLCR